MEILKKIFVTSFFGWDNWKYLIISIISMWSDRDSFFSKKRAESNIAFIAAITILLHHYWTIRATISTAETLEIAGILLGIAGYFVKKIQDEKNDVQP